MTTPTADGKPTPSVEYVRRDSLVTRAPFRALWDSERNPGAFTLSAIYADMKRRGFDPAFPIVVWRHWYGGRNEDLVLDGHTRLEAARQAGIEVIPVVYVHFETHGLALDYAIHCQRDRRSITPAAILRCVKLLQKPKRGRPSKNAAAAAITEPQTDAQLASSLGVSPDTIQRARVIGEHGSEATQQAVDEGKLSIAAAYAATQQERAAASAPAAPPPVAPADPAPAPAPVPAPAPDAPVGADEEDLADEPMPLIGKRGEFRCPFCNSGWVYVDGGWNKKWPVFHVHCDDCSAKGPEVTPKPHATLFDLDAMKLEAVRLWNAAPRPAQIPASAPEPVTRPDAAQAEPAPVAADVERWKDNLWQIASAKPAEQWPAVREAMLKVAALLAEGGAR